MCNERGVVSKTDTRVCRGHAGGPIQLHCQPGPIEHDRSAASVGALRSLADARLRFAIRLVVVTGRLGSNGYGKSGANRFGPVGSTKCSNSVGLALLLATTSRVIQMEALTQFMNIPLSLIVCRIAARLAQGLWIEQVPIVATKTRSAKRSLPIAGRRTNESDCGMRADLSEGIGGTRSTRKISRRSWCAWKASATRRSA